MRALITGGFGFIGSQLASFLSARGWHVTLVDLPAATPCMPLPEGATIIRGRFYDSQVLQDSAQQVDVCFHLASSVGPKNSNANIAYDIETNLMGTVKLFDELCRVGVRRIVYLSSGGTVYGASRHEFVPENAECSPRCSYGIVKRSVEHYLALYNQLFGVEYNVLRLANPYGVGQRLYADQGVIANFIGKILSGVPLEIWGDGSVVRDYVYISDVIRAIEMAATSQAKNEIFNVGSGKGLSLAQILGILETEFGLQFSVHYTNPRTIDVPLNVLDISKARERLGWQPGIGIVEGIGLTLAWAQKMVSQTKPSCLESVR